MRGVRKKRAIGLLTPYCHSRYDSEASHVALQECNVSRHSEAVRAGEGVAGLGNVLSAQGYGGEAR